MSRRWIRLDVDWEESAWLDGITGQAAGCWPRLLCWVKLRGRKGRCKAPDHSVLARRWRVPRQAVDELVDAAKKDGAIEVDGEEIVVTNWAEYQEVDATAAARKRRQRRRERRKAQEGDDGEEGHGDVTPVTRDTVTRPPTTDRDSTSPPEKPGGDVPRARDPVFGDLPSIAVRSIKGLYGWDGSEGTDERVWGDVKEAERPRLLAIAVQRLEGEGKAYQGLLFRRTLETVILENTHGRSAGSAGSARSESGTRKERQDVLVEG